MKVPMIINIRSRFEFRSKEVVRAKLERIIIRGAECMKYCGLGWSGMNTLKNSPVASTARRTLFELRLAAFKTSQIPGM